MNLPIVYAVAMSGKQRGSRGRKSKDDISTTDMLTVLQNTVNSLNTTVLSLNNTVKTLEKSVASQHNLIEKLSRRIEEQENIIKDMRTGQMKHEKLQILKFTGLTLQSADGKAEVITCMKDHLQIEVTSADIVTRIVKNGGQTALTLDAARVPPGRSNSPVPPILNTNCAVLVSFLNIWLRKKVYYAKKALKGKNIFISEDLPKHEGRLFYQCRQLKKMGKIKDTWTKELVVHVKEHTGEVKPIKTDDDLKKYNITQTNNQSSHSMSSPRRTVPRLSPRRRAPQAISGVEERIEEEDQIQNAENTSTDSDGEEYEEAQSQEPT